MMKRILQFAFCAVVIISCDAKKTGRPQTALDTGREFIRASLDGKFDEASALLLPDAENVQLFDSYKAYYQKLPEASRKGYQEASYEINKFKEINDSTTLINYSNSYMQQPMDIKVVRQGKVWMVDFKFIYSPEKTDSLSND